jgi:hypothetical protein
MGRWSTASGGGVVTALCVVMLLAAIILMCCAALTLLRDGARATSTSKLRTAAARGCRLGVASSLALVLSGVACLDGPAPMWGWVMILLGLGGTAAGYLTFSRYLIEAGPARSAEGK